MIVVRIVVIVMDPVIGTATFIVTVIVIVAGVASSAYRALFE